ncbi:histidine phosphatase family protein [Auraticoccus monumenti]|nr:histidine phosphatase family protein [Auraticoccus monumenti]
MMRPASWSSAHQQDPTTDLLLLRHGETPLTPERRFSGTGSSDPGLSEVGLRQAQQAARSAVVRLAGPTVVLTSPLRRCRETADVVAAALGVTVEVLEDLREMDFGEWEGHTFAEVRQRHPDDLAAWKRSADVAPTGSRESFTELLHRVGDVARNLSRAHPGATVLAVTHVTPVKAFVAHALDAPATSFFAMELSPAALTRISYTGEEAVLRSFNDTSHLR